MAKRKEIKWRWEARGTMIGRQNGIIFRIYHPWDMPEREHTVSCYDTKGSARTISTAGYRKFTWEEAVEFCQAIAAGEIDLEDLRAEFAAIEAERERQALRKAVEEAKECWNWRRCGETWEAWDTTRSWDLNAGRAGRMGPDGKGTAQAAAYIDGQPVQYAGEITLPEITAAPEQMESTEAPPLLASMGFTMEQFNETARFMAEAFGIFCDKLAEATRAMVDAWEAIRAAEEFRKALRWAEAANRPLAARYHHTKKKRIRKKYAKRILAWYREEIL